MTLIDRSFRERIVLVGVAIAPVDVEEVEQSLNELSLLIDTAGADEAARVVQKRTSPDPATYIGKGKAEELHQLCLEVDADTVVFDDDLSTAQQRNLEKILGRTAIDRSAVILDIFAQNARTQEGKAQVELALLRYRLPRLRGRGHSFSQQAGGIGTRGPGETKLEEDRRRLLKKMSSLEHDLDVLEKNRRTQRKSRQRSQLHTISLVGYTNAGKSSLLNYLTQAGVLVKNSLFATLDPRTRKLDLPGGESVLLSDTVGFVKKLPHQLIEAFHSTLEVVGESDLLIHVVDSSAENPSEQIQTVRAVLKEIGAGEVPELLAFNKCDLTTEAKRLCDTHPGSVMISAVSGEGIDKLLMLAADRIRAISKVVELFIPTNRIDLIAALHREGEVVSEQWEEDQIIVKVRLEPNSIGKYNDYLEPTSTRKSI